MVWTRVKAVHQKTLLQQLSYMPELVTQCAEAFIEKYRSVY